MPITIRFYCFKFALNNKSLLSLLIGLIWGNTNIFLLVARARPISSLSTRMLYWHLWLLHLDAILPIYRVYFREIINCIKYVKCLISTYYAEYKVYWAKFILDIVFVYCMYNIFNYFLLGSCGALYRIAQMYIVNGELRLHTAIVLVHASWHIMCNIHPFISRYDF